MLTNVMLKLKGWREKKWLQKQPGFRFQKTYGRTKESQLVIVGYRAAAR